MDIITLALAKKFATKISAGYSKVEVDGMDIIFTLNDGSQVTLTVPTPADGVSVTDLDINENNELICTMSDGTTINAGEVPVADLSEYAKTEYVDEENEKLKEELDSMKMVYNAMPKVSDEGSNLTLDNTAECPVYDIELSPSELEQETTSGKNLFNINTTKKANTGTTNEIINNTAKITLTTASTFRRTQFLLSDDNSLLGKTVTISADFVPSGTNSGLVRIYFSNSTFGTWVPIDNEGLSVSGSSETVTIPSSYPSGTSMIVLLLYGNGNSTTSSVGDYVDYSNVQVELGDTATSYEPFTYGASPNPEFPQDIHVVSGDNEVIIRNKNLFDKDNANIINAYINNKLVNSNDSAKTLYISAKPNTTYTVSKSVGKRFSVMTSEAIPAIGVTGTNGIENNTASSITITTGANDKYIAVYFYLSTVDTLTSQEIMDTIQIEEGSTASSFEPHRTQTYPISLGDLEYCGIGDYEDVFFKNVVGSEYYDSTLELDKWYLKKNIGKTTINITTNSLMTTSTYAYVIQVLSDMRPQGNVKTGNFMSNKNRYIDTSTDYNGYPAYVIARNFVISTTLNDTIENLKSKVNGGILYYQLETPTYALLNNTLQTQLNNIQKAISYQDQTNISQTNNDLPFTIKLSAIKDISSL